MKTIFLIEILVPNIYCRNLLSVLSAQPSLTNFTSFLKQSPGLLSQLDAGNHTVLAPSDGAWTSFLQENNAIATITHGISGDNTSDWLDSGLSYHILTSVYSEYALNESSQIIPTLLVDARYEKWTENTVQISQWQCREVLYREKSMSRIVLQT